MAATIDGLRSLGHEVTLVAPRYPGDPSDHAPQGSLRLHLVAARRRSLPASLVMSLARRRPLSVERHAQRCVREAVGRLVAEHPFDIVHVEQPQALTHAGPAMTRGLPVVLRAQNVESELWRTLAAARPRWSLLASREARQLARWEADAIQRVGMTLALTRNDADSLQRLAPHARIRVVRMPMPAQLAAGDGQLEGSPSIVLFAGGGWFPNRDGVTWFLREIWPDVSRTMPGARLHVFGRPPRPAVGPAIHRHPAPEDSRETFVKDSILTVPLRIASGARVRILEAWARGVPVVATPAAASGLDLPEGRGLLVARTADEFAAAFTSLAGAGDRVRQMVEDGRAALRQWHDPRMIALELERAYVDVIGASVGRTD